MLVHCQVHKINMASGPMTVVKCDESLNTNQHLLSKNAPFIIIVMIKNERLDYVHLDRADSIIKAIYTYCTYK